MKSRLALVCTSPLAALFVLNCSVPSFCEGSACGEADGGDGDVLVSRDSSTDGPVADGSRLLDSATGDAAVEAGPPVCDLAADPKDSPACVMDADGVFVDSAGSDSNAGTKTSPLKTISAAVSLAKGTTGRVYVCAGSYADSVTITARVSVYGGFTCGTYVYSGVLPVVSAPAGASALLITGASGVTIEDMMWVSPDASGNDANGNGNSSIAAFVSGATTISIKRATFQAGAGAAALPGSTTGATYSGAAPGGAMGTAGHAGAGGLSMPVTCGNGSGITVDGEGGTASGGGGIGTPGSATPAISPAYPDATHDGAKGGTDCTTAPAHPGSYGLGGAGGTAAPTVGQLTSTSWIPTRGGAGQLGGVGQGGGGGASTDDTGGGGSGSLGGCGGDAGKGGGGGGASIGIIAYQSAISAVALTIRAAGGGIGGSGSKGGAGQNISSAGTGGSATACAGAIGGFGGSGGGGAGGSGGPSAGIIWVGTAPTLDGIQTSNAATYAGVTLSATAASGGGVGGGGDAVTAAARAGQPGAVGVTGALMAVLGI